MLRMLWSLTIVCLTSNFLFADDITELPAIRSIASGDWSAGSTWDLNRVPRQGDRVLIREGHRVRYDVESKDVVRMIQIAGSLEFAADRDTLLNVGLIKIINNEDLTEQGFDCHGHFEKLESGKRRAELLVGTANAPIPANKRAVIRLHYVAGMNKESCPAIVCCGGRMEFHGAPIRHTWSKLSQRGVKGQDRVWMADSPEGWKPGDKIIVTSTSRRRGDNDRSQTEERKIVNIGQNSPKAYEAETYSYGDNALANVESLDDPRLAKLKAKVAVPTGNRDPISHGFSIQLDKALEFDHDGHGDYRGEIANLSRNVVVESADPNGVRGHTMYHVGSQGSISYAEFRHLGKRDVLGRYGIHFHLVEDTMRGSFVKGASVWDSHNRWVVIHGTNYMVVRDCVGFKSVGHGFFMEDGSETFNVFDHNLAVGAMPGKPLPKQVMPFDSNKGAGFWFANCHNVFSNNVAADCEQYGYRFEAKRTDEYNPIVSVLQPDGTRKSQDVRSLPFIKFENNESHAIRHFGMSLRGFPLDGLPQGKFHNDINAVLWKEIQESTPDQRYPFWVHNFKAWETGFGYNAGVGGVFIDGLDVHRSTYGMWRVVLDRNVWRDVKMTEITNKQLHMPFSVGPPHGEGENDRDYFYAIQGFVDDFSPHSVITKVVRSKDEVLVCGSSADSSVIKRVVVNGRPAYSTRENFGEWEVVFGVPADKEFQVTAVAEDALGNIEPKGHRMTVPAIRVGTP
ncbi:MAG: G8 domain-containing protein [Pirellulales bacterium]